MTGGQDAAAEENLPLGGGLTFDLLVDLWGMVQILAAAPPEARAHPDELMAVTQALRKLADPVTELHRRPGIETYAAVRPRLLTAFRRLGVELEDLLAAAESGPDPAGAGHPLDTAAVRVQHPAASSPPVAPEPGAAAEPRRLRIFRTLACNLRPLSTPELTGLLAEPGEHHRLLTKYGTILREEEQAGRVERAGRAHGKRGRPAVTWDITDAGRAWLDEHDMAASASASAEAEAERKAEEARRAAAERDRALDDARASFSRQTPRPERKRAARRLRDLGCTLDQIGRVFGVTREMIRQDLAWDPQAPPKPRKPPAAPRCRPLSSRQAELLLGMYLGQPAKDHPLFIPTFRVLQKRGLIAEGSGPGCIHGHVLTAEGRAAARELAERKTPDD